MRLGYVLSRWPCWSETFVVTEILAHEAAGCEVEVFALKPFAEPRVQPEVARVRARVTRLPEPEPDEARAALAEVAARAPGATEDAMEAFQGLALAREARARGVTHLHAHFARAAATVARIAGAATGIPHSVTCHARDLFHEAVTPEDLRRRLAGARTVVAVSEFNARWIRERGGMEAGRVVVIRNGLDLSRFPFSEPRSRPPVVAAVGRLVPKKGFDVLVDAMAILRRRGIAARCRIAGTGDEAGGLEARIRDRGVADSVTLVGPVPHDAVPAFLGEAAVFAAPCVVAKDGDRDGLPTTILEAMACGTPVVATPVTGVPEAVVAGETGLLVPEEDPGALADAIGSLLAVENLGVRLAVAARSLVEREHDATRAAERLRRTIGAEASS